MLPQPARPAKPQVTGPVSSSEAVHRRGRPASGDPGPDRRDHRPGDGLGLCLPAVRGHAGTRQVSTARPRSRKTRCTGGAVGWLAIMPGARHSCKSPACGDALPGLVVHRAWRLRAAGPCIASASPPVAATPETVGSETASRHEAYRNSYVRCDYASSDDLDVRNGVTP